MKSERRLRNFVILVFILLIVLSMMPASYALGIVPASKELLLDNLEHSYSIRLVNDDFSEKNYELGVVGDLADYISLSVDKISFSSNEKYKEFVVNVDIPENLKIPGGEYLNRIIVKDSSANAGNVAAKVGVVSKLTLVVPYDDAALKTKIFAPNFIKGQQNAFSLEVTNEGIKDAENCRGLLSIQSNTNTELDLLIHEPVDISPGYTQRFLFPWKANLNNGNYFANAKVVCDSVESVKDVSFNIGSANIKVVKMMTDNFRLGQINKFDLLLESEWNDEMKGVYADVSLLKDKDILQTVKTQTSDFEKLGTQNFPLFIDTSDVEPGEYEFIITLHFMGKETIELFNVLFTSDNAMIRSTTGHVVGNTATGNVGNEESDQVSLLMILIVVVILANGALFYLVLRKKK